MDELNLTYKSVAKDVTEDDDGWYIKTNDNVIMLYVDKKMGQDFMRDAIGEFIQRWNHDPYDEMRDVGIYGI